MVSTPLRAAHCWYPITARSFYARYFVRVAAVTEVGEGHLSAASLGVQTGEVTDPAPPRNFTVTAINNTFVEFAWQPAVDLGGQLLECYRLERLVEGSLSNACAMANYTPTGGALVYTESAPGDFSALPFPLNASSQLTGGDVPLVFSQAACVAQSPLQLPAFGSEVARFRIVAATQASSNADPDRVSNYSRTALVVVPAAASPSPPAPVVSVTQATSLVIGFDVPHFDGGCPTLSVDLFMSARTGAGTRGNAGTGPWARQLLFTVDEGLSSLSGSPPLARQVNNLTRATEYRFDVTARNALGGSLPSPLLSVVTSYAPPTPPRWINVTAVYWVSVELAWTPPFDNGGSPIVDYELASALTVGGVPPSPTSEEWTTVRTGSNATTAVVEGLRPGREYAVTVRAITLYDVGAASNPTILSTNPPLPCPSNCSSHGQCHEWDGTCTCDIGYAPPACDTIDGADGVVYTSGHVEAAEYPAFKARFASQMSVVLGISASRVHVLGLGPATSSEGTRRLFTMATPDVSAVTAAAVGADNMVQSPAAVAGHSTPPRVVHHRRVPSVRTGTLGSLAVVESLPPEGSMPHARVASSPPSRALVGVPRSVPRRRRANVVSNQFMRVHFVILNDASPGATPSATLMSAFQSDASASEPKVAALGVVSVVVANSSVPVSAPNCGAPGDCESCLTRLGCGFCSLRGECELGTRLGPGFGHETCEGHWFHADPLSANNTCLPHCNTLSGCDACMDRSDCTFCESSGTCAPRMPADLKGSCPDVAGIGWMTSNNQCPSQRCLAKASTCGSCVDDPGCGFCATSPPSCFAGDSFGPHSPRSCLAGNWRYSAPDCTVHCSADNTCQSCFAATNDGYCGWCPALVRCGSSNDPGANSTGPLAGYCGDWIGAAADCPPYIPSDTERCLAARSCTTCLSTETTDGLGCAWCGVLGVNSCQLNTATNRAKCALVSHTALTDYCEDAACAEQKFVYSRNGTIEVGSVGSPNTAVPVRYVPNESCDWVITPVEVVTVGTSSSGSTSTMRFPLVYMTVVALDLAAGDSLTLYDGKPATSTTLARFTQADNGYPSIGVESETGYMHVRFRTDKTEEATGFKLVYSSGACVGRGAVLGRRSHTLCHQVVRRCSTSTSYPRWSSPPCVCACAACAAATASSLAAVASMSTTWTKRQRSRQVWKWRSALGVAPRPTSSSSSRRSGFITTASTSRHWRSSRTCRAASASASTRTRTRSGCCLASTPSTQTASTSGYNSTPRVPCASAM